MVIREALDFIERGGRIKLITSTKFSQDDLALIHKSVENKIADETDMILSDDLGKQCLALFARMLSTTIDGSPQIEIKILVPKHGMFHPKVGVFVMDNGDMVSFSGSVNETGMGWAGNVEEFKAFSSWQSEEYVQHDMATFDDFWNNEHEDIMAYDLPKAARDKILAVRPGSNEEYRGLLNILRAKLRGQGRTNPVGFSLRDYQKHAIRSWTARGFKGILEMPTATGKTFTAMGCMNRIQRERGRLFTVIAVPYSHLAKQWLSNVDEWNNLVRPGQRVSVNHLNVASNYKWKLGLKGAVAKFNKKKIGGGYVLNDYIVCTTYNSLANPEFMETVRNVDGELMLVADEAHNSGSKENRKGLIEAYSARLGLTATPDRYFDEEGSRFIKEYFGGIAYSMNINKAIERGYLVQYDYYPIFAELNAAEAEEYRRLTRLIALNHVKKGDENGKDTKHNHENKRARLVAKIEQKYDKLASILDKHGNKLQDALIYCHDGKQLVRAGKILTEHDVVYETITEDASPNERWDRIKSLEKGNHQCILSMKCLDEGVDIPSAGLGIIMASTGNMKQYIQRRGRLLRQFKEKDHAVIYDILAAPPPGVTDRYARKLVAKELLRHKEFAESARNKYEAINMIRPTADRLDIDLDKLDLDYVLGL